MSYTGGVEVKEIFFSHNSFKWKDCTYSSVLIRFAVGGDDGDGGDGWRGGGGGVANDVDELTLFVKTKF